MTDSWLFNRFCGGGVIVSNAHDTVGLARRVLGGALLAGSLALLAESLGPVPPHAAAPASAAGALGAGTALAFCVIGAALLMAGAARWQTRALRVCALSVLAIAALGGLDSLAALRPAMVPAWLPLSLPSSTMPGLTAPMVAYMAPSSALGLLCCALVLLTMPVVRTRAAGRVVQLANLGVIILGALGLLAYPIELELMYDSAGVLRMPEHAALGFLAAGTGLWLCWRNAPWYAGNALFSEAEKVSLTGAALAFVVALSAGMGVYATQHQAMSSALAERFGATAARQTELFQELLRDSDQRARMLSISPALGALGQGGATDGKVLLQSMLGPAGIAGLRVLDGAGRELALVGRMADRVPISAALRDVPGATLYWDDGAYLRHTLRRPDGGTLVLDRALPLLTAFLLEPPRNGSSAETGLCKAAPRQLACFPQARNPRVYRTAHTGKGGAPVPMSRAVAGERGVMRGEDYRGRQVFAAYATLDSAGLGLVVKQDTADLYAPLARQLERTLPLLLLFVCMAAWVLRSVLRPVFARLEASEAALRGARDLLELRVAARTAELEQEVAERIRTEKTLLESRASLRAMAAHQQRVVEDERKRIARELHDELGGVLSGIRAYLSYAQHRERKAGTDADADANANANAGDPALRDAASMADSAIDTVRRVITDLRPSVLDQLGLWGALEWYCGALRQRAPFALTLDVAPQCATVDPGGACSTALFRIVQEALTNVERHAHAGHVVVRARLEAQPAGTTLCIEIRDDGRGMLDGDLEKPASWGVAGMRERAHHAGALLSIGPASPVGTVVDVQLDVQLDVQGSMQQLMEDTDA